MVTHNDHPIVAHCSGRGPGAIGIIRIAGVGAIEIADSIGRLADGKKLIDHSTHTIHYGKVIDSKGKIVDTVLFLLMRGPKTFTGQDTVEITCHNNPFLIETIIERAIEKGARTARPGEFTQRAVNNKKLDLIQAEAIHDLIHASSQEAIKRSLSQMEGTLSYEISAIEKKLVKALAFSEASFEFLDEQELGFTSQIRKIIDEVLKKITLLQDSFSYQKQIKEGVRIALIGSVNAGKSSLFNALIGSQRAIVTDHAGTTRDVIEASLAVDGLYWTLIDTAGLRDTENVIEAEGISRSYKEAHTADIILLIVDGSRTLTPQEITLYKDLLKRHEQKIILIYQKTDLTRRAQSLKKSFLALSSNDDASVKKLKKELKSMISSIFKKESSPYLLTQRQYTLLSGLTHKLEKVKPLLEGEVPYELISYHLQEALSDIAELLGKSVSEQAMDAVFREFCVGK